MREQFEKLLRDEGSLYTLNDILQDIRIGAKQSFTSDETWAITEVVKFPRGNVLQVIYVIGKLDRFGDLARQIEAFAKDAGCVQVSALGRESFRHVCEQYGWKAKYVQFEKDLI